MNDVFGKQLGQYILLEQLGEGGMAKVYNAFDSRAETNVAIKVILPSKRTSKVFLQQFEREAKALANLTHTNIVKVLNYGIQDGQPYLVMEYISGGTLKEAMNQKLPWQTAAAILAPIARALDYVHQQQIVHRDVKPSNILLQEDFSPMLSDFGILKLLEGKDEKVDEAIGAGVGTPEYMAPEQGMGKDVDFRADIYALGLVFYEMITGQKPYIADSPMAVVIKHVTDELPLPTKVDKNIPKFVERVILRAVQKDPKNRYLSMGHFADALELIALGDRAPERKIIQVSKQREKRQRSYSIYALSMLLIILVLSTGFFTYNYFKESEAASGTPQLTLPATGIVAYTATSQSSLAHPPTPTLATAPKPTPTLVNTSTDLTLLGTPLTTDRKSQFNEIARWGLGGTNVVRWDVTGQRIALGTTSGIFIYDSQTNALLLFINTQFNVVQLAFSPLDDNITAGSPTGEVKTWSSTSGQFIQNYTFQRPPANQHNDSGAVTAITYSSDGKYVAVGYKNGALNYFPINQGTPKLVVENYPAVEDLVISPDTRFIYASNGTKDILIWDIQSGKKAKDSPLSNPTPITNLAMSKDQQFILAGGNGNSVYLWDLAELRHVTSFSNPGDSVMDFDFSYDTKSVAVGLFSGTINIFAMPSPADYSKTFKPAVTIPAFDEKILSIASSPDELIIASAGLEEGLRLWNAQSGQNTFTLEQSMRGAINEIYLSKDGNWLATSHADGKVRVWDVNDAQKVFEADGYLPKGLPFSPDNHYLTFIQPVGQNKPDQINLLDLKQQKVVQVVPGYLQKTFVQFTNDSKLLVMGNPYLAKIWDVSTWEQLDMHGGPNAGCGQYFTPQNNLLAAISNAGIMFVYDDKVQAMCGTKPVGATFVYYFYQEHQMLFVKSDGTMWSWDFHSDKLAALPPGAPYPSPGEIFLTADQQSGWYASVEDNVIRIQNVGGQTGTTIVGQNDYRYHVALLPDKKLMALGSKYGSIHIWTMP